ncbi:MAG: hypothetical protein FWC64_03310 [Treponema sp.]|nr:hypothetical protein [Treponema sp.]
MLVIITTLGAVFKGQMAVSRELPQAIILCMGQNDPAAFFEGFLRVIMAHRN